MEMSETVKVGALTFCRESLVFDTFLYYQNH